MSTNTRDKFYNQKGSVLFGTLLIFFIFIPLFMLYGTYTRQNQILIKKILDKQEKIIKLKQATGKIIVYLGTSNVDRQLNELKSDYNITIEELSGKLNPYFIDKLFFDLKLFRMLAPESYTPQNIVFHRDDLGNNDLINSYIPYPLQHLFTNFSYINVNVDNMGVIQNILRYNRIEDSKINYVMNLLKKSRGTQNYLDNDDLEQLRLIADHPITSLFTIEPQLNINTLDKDLLADLLSVSVFNVIDIESTIEKIRQMQNNNEIINKNTLKQIIRTNLGNELIFNYLGDSTWFYEVESCDNEYCVKTIIRRNQFDKNDLRIVRESVKKL